MTSKSESKIFSSERLLSVIIGLLSVITCLVIWFYTDNRENQLKMIESNNLIVQKLTDKLEYHINESENRFNQNEKDIVTLQIETKNKMR